MLNWKIWLAAFVLLAAVLSSVENYLDQAPSNGGEQGAALVVRSFLQEKSGVWVNFEAVVVKVLQDDRRGSRHQRFIVRLNERHTVLISHNIDLAPRVPLGPQDQLQIKGRYEWNPKGGVVHWTHHDPDGRHAGGWVLYHGVKFH